MHFRTRPKLWPYGPLTVKMWDTFLNWVARGDPEFLSRLYTTTEIQKLNNQCVNSCTLINWHVIIQNWLVWELYSLSASQRAHDLKSLWFQPDFNVRNWNQVDSMLIQCDFKSCARWVVLVIWQQYNLKYLTYVREKQLVWIIEGSA